MPWSTRIHADDSIVETAYEGRLSPSDLDAAVARTVALAHATPTRRLLADLRALEGGHALVNLLAKAEEIKVDASMAQLREAILVVPGSPAAPLARFWEDVARNRGIDVRIFVRRDDAVAWLREVPVR